MLEVLDSAQAAGQRAQQDAQMGQGSIFDLFDAGADGRSVAVRRAVAPADPDDEFERTELLAMEKESIGIFISEHPLKRVREALQVKADCSTAEVIEQPRRRVGQGRRHDHRVQEDPHPHRARR